MFAVGNCDGVNESGQERQQEPDAKSKSQYDENAPDTSGERPKKTPPIQMRMKMKYAHGAAELCPTMVAGKKHRTANNNENEPHTRAQK